MREHFGDPVYRVFETLQSVFPFWQGIGGFRRAQSYASANKLHNIVFVLVMIPLLNRTRGKLCVFKVFRDKSRQRYRTSEVCSNSAQPGLQDSPQVAI